MIKHSKIKLQKIAKKFQLADVYLFGSKISNFSRKESDLDIAVRFKNGLPKAEERGKIYGNLFSELGQCFKHEKIDLVFVEEAPLHFKFNIINGGQLIYSKNKENSMIFVENTANYYRDYKFFIDEFMRGILETSVK